MNYFHWLKKNMLNKTKTKNSSPVSSIITKKHITKLSSITIRDLYKQHNFKLLVSVASKKRGSIEEYDSINVQGNVIKVGESVLVNSGEDHNEDYLGTIKQIISIKEPTTLRLICLCKVQWFMRKSEVLKMRLKEMDWISDQELFLTNNEDYILAQTIIQPCQVLSCNEYIELDEIDSTVYFNRLEWNIERKQFNHFDKLQQFCSCNQPVNPDRQYIQCDSCKKWYHFECAGVQDEAVGGCDFYCKFCK